MMQEPAGMSDPDLNTEAARLAALARYRILDTAPEPAFDAITRLAARICDTPMALISLVDAQRLWFKAKVGLDVQEMPLHACLCPITVHEFAVRGRQPLVVPDALKDPRFAAHPAVTAAPHLRFYVGLPLRTPQGQVLGALCVLDRVPRRLSEAQMQALHALADETMMQLELRRERLMQFERPDLVLSAAGEGIFAVDLQSRLIFINAAAERILKWPANELLGQTMHAIIPPVNADGTPYSDSRCGIYATLRDGQARRENEGEVFHRKDGTAFPVSYISTPMPAAGERLGAAVVFRDTTESKKIESALRESEAQLRLITDSVPALIAYVDAERRYRFANRAYQEWFGRRPEHVVGRHLREVMGEVAYRRILPHVERALAGQRASFETQVPYKLGPARYISASYIPDFGDRGDVRGYVSLINDITARKRAEAELQESEARKSAMLSTALDGIITMDHTGRIVEFNPAAEAMFGYARAQVLGAELAEKIIPPRLREAHRQGLEQYMKTGRARMLNRRIEVSAMRADGSEFAAELSIAHIPVEGPPEFTAYLRDITERKRAEDRLSHLASYDTLTQLPNRVLLMDRLHQALAQAPRHGRLVAVLFLDLDRFKNINDSLGHQVGDLLLKEVAQRLSACVRESDTVARLGGDEFVVMLTELTRPADAAQLAQKLVRALQEPFEIVGQPLTVEVSVGVALYPKDAEDAGTLLKNADTAMYRAKERGRNQYREYSKAMGARAARRLSLENDLRRALSNNEFELRYQPQVDLSSRRIVAAEVYLRWRRPGWDRLVRPSDFLHDAEARGLAIPISEWVLRAACAQQQSWQAQGCAPLRVAVYLSAAQVHQPNLAKTIGRILKQTGCPTPALELQLSESLLHGPEVERVLRSLKQRGVRIALGSVGYSSLGYLKRLTVDHLKIDRTFVRDLPDDAGKVAALGALIAAAHNRQVEITAEGVETSEQLELLCTLGCDAAQGFLLGKPMPANELTKLLCTKEPDGKPLRGC
jgi:diguanylate cyclase (GGDEF)-like protein/PAS domain S-box-containing protein